MSAIENHFGARWALSVKLVSAVVSLLMVGLAVKIGSSLPDWGLVIGAGLLAVPAAAALFTIRGYVLRGDQLLVQRLLWDTRISLAALLSATRDPQAMRGSWRLFGNGGLFSVTGWFRNRDLGLYRAFVMAPRDAVVLRFAGRVIVVSPSQPERFVESLPPRASLASAGS